MDASNSSPHQGYDSDGADYRLKCVDCSAVWSVEQSSFSGKEVCPGCGERRDVEFFRAWWLREECRISEAVSIEVPTSTREAAEELVEMDHCSGRLEDWLVDLVDLDVQYRLEGQQ